MSFYEFHYYSEKYFSSIQHNKKGFAKSFDTERLLTVNANQRSIRPTENANDVWQTSDTCLPASLSSLGFLCLGIAGLGKEFDVTTNKWVNVALLE